MTIPVPRDLRGFVESAAGQQTMTLVILMIGVWMVDAQSRGEVGKQLVMFALGVMSRSMETKKDPKP